MNKRPYKPVGNLAVDMVAASINHYQRQDKKLTSIKLQRSYWIMFTEYVLKQIPGYDLSDDTVEFDGVKVQRGSDIMQKEMYFEFEKEAQKVYLVN